MKLDLTGCFYTDCYLCESGVKGGSHTLSGPDYSGICRLCKKEQKVARYDGESGRSGYYRTTKGHKKSILDKNEETSAFSKHLKKYHPEREGDPSVFELRVESTHKKCLQRQVTEGVFISNTTADYIMNSKTEFHQPSVNRVVTTREVRSHGS